MKGVYADNCYFDKFTGSEDATIKLWDLRKLHNFHTIRLDDSGNEVYQVNDLAFDYSGHYLACAGTDVRCVLLQLTQHTMKSTLL